MAVNPDISAIPETANATGLQAIWQAISNFFQGIFQSVFQGGSSTINAIFDGIWHGLAATGNWIYRHSPEFARQPFYADSEYMQGWRQMFDNLWYGLTHIPEFLRFVLSTMDVRNVLPFADRLATLGASEIFAFLLNILLGVFLARVARSIATRALRRTGTSNRQVVMLTRRAVFYIIFALFFISALRAVGVDFQGLGTALGVFTLAIGFAAQTSVSNLISGLFLLGERVAELGDVIEVDGSVGEVIAIDLISTKLRTFDNVLIRIPNEKMVNAKIKNMSAFPIRRVNMKIGVAYKEDLERVREILFEVAARNPMCLAEPKPVMMVDGYGDSAVDLLFFVWAARSNWFDLKNQLHIDVKKALDLAEVEIPFPHLSIYTGEATKPFPTQAFPTQAMPDTLPKTVTSTSAASTPQETNEVKTAATKGKPEDSREV